jgi:hypothetical protein
MNRRGKPSSQRNPNDFNASQTMPNKTYTTATPRMLASNLILTITPDHSVLVSLRDANGAPYVERPPRKISADLDRRLGAFVAAVEAIARLKLASIEPPTTGPDHDPAIAGDDADSKPGR